MERATYRLEYLDRDGNPLSFLEWAQKIETRDYGLVAKTVLPDGKRVSTIWLGISFEVGRENLSPIFETRAFSELGRRYDLDVGRYSTEAEAMAGHEAMCRKWTSAPEPAAEENL